MAGDHTDKELLRSIGATLREILEEVEEIRRSLKPKLTQGRIWIMPKTIKVGESATATLQGLDQNGQPFVIDAKYGVVYTASAPGDVMFSPPGTDGSDVVLGVNADPSVSITASVTRPDGVVVSFAGDVLDVEPQTPVPVLTSGTVVLQ